MESFFVHLVHAAIWLFVIGFILAIIGLITVIRWIVGMFTAGGRAVESGVQGVEHTLERR